MSTPLFCPICDFVMNTFEDSVSFEESECCQTCQDNWGKEIKFDKRENLLDYKKYIEKRLNQTKAMLPILRFE